MPNITLKGKVVITAEVEAVTGLHIGGAAAGLDIGGIDNPIIRHPVTREPYIPGSSLRGKMRSLLDKHFGKDANKFIQRREPVVRVHECETENEYARSLSGKAGG
jgi:CRISPR-associated protein Csm3